MQECCGLRLFACSFALCQSSLLWSRRQFRFSVADRVLFVSAQSLRLTLLAAGWSCTAMSAVSAVGLLALGLQLKAKEVES